MGALSDEPEVRQRLEELQPRAQPMLEAVLGTGLVLGGQREPRESSPGGPEAGRWLGLLKLFAGETVVAAPGQ